MKAKKKIDMKTKNKKLTIKRNAKRYLNNTNICLHFIPLSCVFKRRDISVNEMQYKKGLQNIFYNSIKERRRCERQNESHFKF
jgi:hypothetical protein